MINKIEYYYNRPIEFAIDVIDFSPDKNQQRIFDAIKTDKRISVKSGSGIGKTASLAVIVLWYLFTRYDAKIILTSPTMTQLYTVLFKELIKWKTSTILDHYFGHTKTTIYNKMTPASHFVIAKTSSTPESISGDHAVNMMIIIDEASGVSNDILDVLNATVSSDTNKLIMISNPTRTEGTFYDSFNSMKKYWTNITVNAENSERVSDENIKYIAEKYGKESPVYKVRVLGEFPEGSENSIIKRKLIIDSIKNDHIAFKTAVIYGYDVAKGTGGDSTVIYRDTGSSPILMKKSDSISIMESVGLIINDIKKQKGKEIIVMVDSSGLGAGAVDRLEEVISEQEIEANIYEVNHGSPVVFKPRYYGNQIGEMFFMLKDLLQEKKIKVPNDNDLIEDLSGREIAFTSGGKIIAEKKDIFKKRIGRSPDLGDAFLLCIYGLNYV